MCYKIKEGHVNINQLICLFWNLFLLCKMQFWQCVQFLFLLSVTIKPFNFVITFTNANRNKNIILLVSLSSFGHYFTNFESILEQLYWNLLGELSLFPLL